MPKLVPCVHCGQHVFLGSCACAHCGATLRECGKAGNKTAAAVMLGFTLSGCAGGGEGGVSVELDYGTGAYYYAYPPHTGDTGDTDADTDADTDTDTDTDT